MSAFCSLFDRLNHLRRCSPELPPRYPPFPPPYSYDLNNYHAFERDPSTLDDCRLFTELLGGDVTARVPHLADALCQRCTAMDCRVAPDGLDSTTRNCPFRPDAVLRFARHPTPELRWNRYTRPDDRTEPAEHSPLLFDHHHSGANRPPFRRYLRTGTVYRYHHRCRFAVALPPPGP